MHIVCKRSAVAQVKNINIFDGFDADASLRLSPDESGSSAKVGSCPSLRGLGGDARSLIIGLDLVGWLDGNEGFPLLEHPRAKDRTQLPSTVAACLTQQRESLCATPALECSSGRGARG